MKTHLMRALLVLLLLLPSARSTWAADPTPVPTPAPQAVPVVPPVTQAGPVVPPPPVIPNPVVQFFADRQVQVSKWALDVAVSSFMAPLLAIAGVVIAMADTLDAYVFDVPVDALTGTTHDTVKRLAELIANAGLAVLVLVFSYRMVAILTGYRDERLTTLLSQTVLALVLIWGGPAIGAVMIRFAHAVCTQLRDATGVSGVSLITVIDTQMYGSNLTVVLGLFFYAVLTLILIYQAFRRIVIINLLLVVSPLIGVSVIFGGSWGYARVWTLKMVEQLITPILLIAGLVFVQSTADAFVAATQTNGTSATDITIRYLISTFGYLMLAAVPQLVGLASRDQGAGMAAAVGAIGSGVRGSVRGATSAAQSWRASQSSRGE